MSKPIRSQSKDAFIREAAKQGIKVYSWSGAYWTCSAAQCAREAHVSIAQIRRFAVEYLARENLVK